MAPPHPCESPAFCHHYPVSPNERSRHIRHTHAGLIDPNLYGDKLQMFCRQNQIELNISRAKAISYDPCYEYGIKHWHPTDPSDKRLTQQYACLPDKIEKRPVDQIPASAGQTRAVVKNFFMDRREFDIRKKQTLTVEEEGKNFCQICARTGRQKDMPRRKRVPPKPRRKYVVPLPYVRPKSPPPPPEPEEVLYKVEVKTGDAANAGTTTPIFISLIGKSGFTQRQRLGKKQGSLPFSFQRCTRETFHVKCRDVGLLRAITLEHESARKEDSWFVDEVTITDIAAKDIYSVPCGKWLSMWEDDLAVKRKFAARKQEQIVRKFEITTVTGNHAMAGLNGKVFVSFVGKKRKTGKLRLHNDSEENFKPGMKEKFFVSCDDFGQILQMRIEHDGGYGSVVANKDEGQTESEKQIKAAKEWLLESVRVKDLLSAEVFDFEINEWLGIHSASGDCHKDLTIAKDKPKDEKGKQKGKEEEKEEDVMYDFQIMTGKKSLSGTDSTVYIQLVGSKRKSNNFTFEDRDKSHFESGATDVFRMRGPDVGDIQKIRVSHSDMGRASGWFLDKIVIKRYFTRREIYEKLKAMKDKGRLPLGLCFKGGSVVLGDQSDEDEEDSEESDEEEDDDSDDSDDEKEERRRRMAKKKAEKERERIMQEEVELEAAAAEEAEESLFSKLRRRQSSLRGSLVRDLEEEEEAARRAAKLRQKPPSGPARGLRSRSEIIEEEEEEETRADRRRAAAVRAQMEATGRDPEVDRIRRQSRRHLPSVSMRSGMGRSDSFSSDEDEEEEEEEENGERRKRRPASVIVSLPMGEEFCFECKNWLAKDEGDGRTERFLALKEKRPLQSQLRVREKS